MDFGHAKRDACALRHLARLLTVPEGSPSTEGDGWAEAKSWYDLLDNPAVSVQDLRAWRAAVLEEGLRTQTGPLLAIHDVSVLDYSRQASKTDRRAIGDGRGQGYEYHACLALDPHREQFLGIAHDTVVSHDGPDDVEAMDYEGDPLCADLPEAVQATLPTNHRHQMAVHIRGLQDAWGGRPVIHVGDREFDDVPAMVAARAVGHDFVFRVLGNRTVHRSLLDAAGDETWQPVAMADLVTQLSMVPYKELALDAQERVTSSGCPHRVARLSIGACRIRLFRPFTRGGHCGIKLPSPVEVNLVVVRELDAPAGKKAVCWLLVTSLPIATFEQQAWVAYVYEQRWSIEEYFKFLKSGLGLERAKYTDATKTAKALVFYSLAAVGLLSLKACLGLPATGPLDEPS